MLQFLKTILATLIGLILFTAFGAIGITVLIVGATQPEPVAPKVRKKSVLVYDLSLGIQDNTPGTSSRLSDPFSAGDNSASLRAVVKTIQAAAEDEKIVALYLQGGDPSAGGYATLKEVRDALKTFRKSGKPIYAYDSDWSEPEYYLASVADTIALDPIGSLTLDGFSAEVRFYADALEKYGLGMQVVRVGQFKSAVEPYLNNGFSPSNRQQTETLLNSLWQNFLVTLGDYRELNAEQLQAIANNQGILNPTEALNQTLIDQISYPDEIETALKELTGGPEDEPFRQKSLLEYAKTVEEQTKGDSDNQIAVVYLEGSIVNGEGNFGVAGSESIAKLLRKVRKDEDVKAVVLRVNSPGGSATAASIMGREVTLLAETKPLVVSMGDYAASGGYWVSAPARQIFASPGTITGSIGTYGLLPNIQKIANDNGITWDDVKTAPFANSSTIARPKTPQELALNQKTANAIYDRFLEIVAEGRSLPREDIAKVAEGRVWSGISAKSLGLVDELGGLEDAIDAAGGFAELEPGDWNVKEYPRQRSFEEALIAEFFSVLPSSLTQPLAQQNQPLPAPLAEQWNGLQSDLQDLTYLNDPKGVYTRMPFNLEIR